jgi:cystathionine beta-lyase
MLTAVLFYAGQPFLCEIMKYDFDKIINRENSGSVKYDMRKEYFGTVDVLPMWVADMDFEAPPEVVKELTERAAHGIYGYSFRDNNYYDAIVKWLKNRHNWNVEPNAIRFSPGIVTAINLAIQTFSKPGDGVIVQPPVYFPFFNAVKNNNRKMLENRLVNNDGHYEMDFELLEKQAKEAKILLLSSPHNPVGRCWTKTELETVSEICLKNDVLIISDEIHNDLIMPGYKHIPMATISEQTAQNTVTFIAPSKTFNLAGLFTSSVIIQNMQLLEKFDKKLESLHLVHGNLFGYLASTVAYQKGAAWLDQLIEYVQGNFDYLAAFIDDELSQLKMSNPEATYLAWVDFNGTGFSDDELNDILIKKAKSGFSRGSTFGKGGEGFMRINVATPRKNIEIMCDRLSSIFRKK